MCHVGSFLSLFFQELAKQEIVEEDKDDASLIFNFPDPDDLFDFLFFSFLFFSFLFFSFLFFSFLFFSFLFFSFLFFPFLSFPFLSFPFLSFPFLSFPFLSSPFLSSFPAEKTSPLLFLLKMFPLLTLETSSFSKIWSWEFT